MFNDKPQIWADNAASSPYFGRVYSCFNAFRSNGRHRGDDNPPLPLMVVTSADGGATWQGSKPLTAADTTGAGPDGWGMSGYTVRSDSRGTVFVFAEMADNQAITGAPPPQGVKTTPLPSHGDHLMFQSFDGGATWTWARPIFRVTDPYAFVDPVSLHCVVDGYTGARADLGGTPSIDIANGAPPVTTPPA